MNTRTAYVRIPPNAPLAWRIVWPLIAIVLLLVACSALIIIPIAAAGAYLVAALLGLVGIRPRPRQACPSCGVVFKVSPGALQVCPACNTILGTAVDSSASSATSPIVESPLLLPPSPLPPEGRSR